jgi:hypothetical protein
MRTFDGINFCKNCSVKKNYQKNIISSLCLINSRLMKQFLTAILLFLTTIFNGQTATNFVANSCDGVEYELFDRLDSGQVIVLSWVKPDNTDLALISSAYNVVKEFQMTYPNRVFLFICDDYANTSCAGLNNWVTNNAFTDCTTFSDSAIKMSDYLLNSVPKVAVVGTSAHHVFTVQATVDDSSLRTAIHSAIIGPIVQNESMNNYFQTKLNPIPADNNLTIDYKLEQAENIVIEIINTNGKRVVYIINKGSQGPNTVINTGFIINGSYILKLSNGDKADVVKFIVTHS